ncbi:hypothetical protein [Streptomyces ehimensis]|uniref:Uncharacterized protein n=1 Tax=Streptomyces ehimensis TaxID=68195 RepID=A0ABV9BV98_9ACTN
MDVGQAAASIMAGTTVVVFRAGLRVRRRVISVMGAQVMSDLLTSGNRVAAAMVVSTAAELHKLEPRCRVAPEKTLCILCWNDVEAARAKSPANS